MFARVGRPGDIAAGQMRAVDVDGTRVNVANVAGQFYAIDDACTHARCSLANGTLAGTTVTCACHGSQFDVTTGAVLSGPARRPVRPHVVRVEADGLLVEP